MPRLAPSITLLLKETHLIILKKPAGIGIKTPVLFGPMIDPMISHDLS